MKKIMGRRAAREIALQALFQLDLIVDMTVERALEAAAGEHDVLEAKIASEYASVLVNGVMTKRNEIDELVAAYVSGWTLDRLPNVERNILRLCVYEIKFVEPLVKVPVAINEAVELAKIYGEANAPAFINGVMGKLVRGTEGQK